MCGNTVLTGLGKGKDAIPDKGANRIVSKVPVQD